MTSKPTRSLLIAGLCLTASLSSAGSKLTGFTTKTFDQGFEVHIAGTNLAKPSVQRVMSNRSMLLTFDADLVGRGERQKVNKNGLEFVQSAWFSARPPKARVHLRLDPKAEPSVTPSDNGWVVAWNKPSAEPKNVILAAIKEKTEPFPATVPPIKEVKSKPIANRPSEPTVPLVSLDFVNTEVVQILKALAMQAGVNIVTSPDVKGALTVSLANIKMNEALDLVTTLAGVRYAKVGSTFIVTAGSKFAEAMRQIGGAVQEGFETRVVNIFSGEGNQIKAAMLHSAVLDTGMGKVELVLPSEEVNVEKKDVVLPEGSDPTKKGDDSKMSIETKSSKESVKDPYIVVVGPGSQLASVQRQIEMIDKQICLAMGVEVPTSTAMVRSVYHPNGATAVNLLTALGGTPDKSSPNRTKIGSVELIATPSGSVSGQAIVLYGRENEVAKLMASLESIDGANATQASFMIYDVKYADPRALRDELKSRLPGLNISIPPGAASNPGLYNSGKSEDANQGSGTNTSGASATSGQTSAGGAAGGLTGAFKGLESGAFPMRLLLNGSADQLRQAADYLAAMDVAPKQVALELRVVELTNDDSEKIGLKWNLSTAGSISSIGVDHGLTGGIISGTITNPGAGPSTFQMALDKLLGSGKTIARPNLLAVDGRQTETFIGNEVRYVQSIQSTQNGVTVTTGQVNVGIGVAVFPRIGGNEEITMDLRTEVSSLQTFIDIPGGGKLPQTGHRVSQTTVQLKSGETIALGGLIQDTDSVTESGIPILKDIPIIGRLFSRKDKSKNRTEIILLVTAKIVDARNRGTAADPRNGKDGSEPKTKQGTDQVIKH